MATLVEEYDNTKGKSFVCYEGVKYWWWPKRGFYVSQRGGKVTMLHRLLYWNGDKSYEVYPLDGDWKNLSPSNWRNRRRGAYHYTTEREYQEFDYKKFYRKDNGYWWSKAYGSMHRYVWEFYNGPVPKGYHVHHKDRDTRNNSIENLELMEISKHLSIHAKENAWVGSEGNKKQLRQANIKRWADYRASEERYKSTGV